MGGKHDTVLPTTGFSTSVPTSTGGSLDFEILFRAAKSGGFSVADGGPISIVVVLIVAVLISGVVVLIIVACNNSSHNNVQ
jgi:hypothetical protein